jgi:hypothetical protein
VALLTVLFGGVVLVSSALADISSVTDLFAGSDVVLITSKTNLPIATADRMLPGDRARGVIKVGNFGTRTGVLYVKPRRIVDKPGPRGGHLSWRLTLRIQELRADGTTRTAWFGHVTELTRRVRIGTLKPGTTRRYRFTVHYRMWPPARSAVSPELLMGASYKTDWVFVLKPKR